MFVVNDRADVARLSGASGLHVGQDDLPVDRARRVLLPTQMVGVSTHTPGQLAGALHEHPDYVAYGPVFATESKWRPDPAVGLEGVSAAASTARRGRTPLVAIGGITVENARDVLAAGASAVAVIGGLLRGDPAKQAEEFVRRTSQ
jgi:thiamine-phosphate pyrophosphorylase